MSADWVRERRKELGITQAQLAERLGVSTSYVSNWETGRRRISADDLIRLSRQLGAVPVPKALATSACAQEVTARIQHAAKWLPGSGLFVVVTGDETRGPAKLVQICGQTATVEYFEHPGQEGRELLQVPLSCLKYFRAPPQTRCYFLDSDGESWRVGRVKRRMDADAEYEVDLPNYEALFVPEERLYVRCNRPIADPTYLLQLKAHETPYFHDRRHGFFQSLVSQRAAARGMTGLLSSSIELFPHQVEVVRRVLEDPVQRYFLADEVGLGKTIEAGVILRQYLLDNPRGSVRLFVPSFLLGQWRSELEQKFDAFKLGDVQVLSTDSLAEAGDDSIPGMVVLDEAHHIAALAFSTDESECARFEAFRRLAHGTERLLLLSATPALNNEKSFLAMLHLLDPVLHRLEDVERFRMRVAKRQQVGRLLLSLREGAAPMVVRGNLRTLRETFAGDEKLAGLATALEQTLDLPDKAARDAAIRALRLHVSETYRLHRRLLRNRRRPELLTSWRYAESFGGGRHRPLVEEFDSDERAGHVLDLLESWRSLAQSHLLQESASVADSVQRLFCLLWECAGTYLEVLGNAVESRLAGRLHANLRQDFSEGEVRLLCTHPFFEGEQEVLRAVLEAIQTEPEDGDRVGALLELLEDVRRREGKASKVLVFTAFSRSCDIIVERLRASLGDKAVASQRAGRDANEVEEEVARFLQEDSGCNVLVCDRTGEEGHNLQAAEVLVHFDLPLAPNRIEQRIGRLDRIGRSRPLRSRVFVGPDRDESLHHAWYGVLKDGFGVFHTSIAALQFFIEDQLPGLREALFSEGAKGLEARASRLAEAVKQEHVRLGEQDALDAIEALSKDSTLYFQGLKKFDEDSGPLEVAMDRWAVEALHFEKRPDAEAHLVYQYEASPRTLVPLDLLLERMVKLLQRPGTHHRHVAGRRSNTALFRIGDAFVDVLERYMRWDDRGRCFAMWRHVPGWDASPDADRFFFRFNYLVEADLAPASVVAQEVEGRFEPSALRRRADALYSPFTETIFMDGRRTEVTKPEWLAHLMRPYSKYDDGGSDWNLSEHRTQEIERLVGPGMWASVCEGLRESSEVHLRMRDEYIRHVEQLQRIAEGELSVRLQQLQLRVQEERRDFPERAAVFDAQLRTEERLMKALLEGIHSPTIRLDSIGFIILSGRPLEATRRRGLY